jgi:phosphoenolpyruvate carboxykinase (ATP)
VLRSRGKFIDRLVHAFFSATFSACFGAPFIVWHPTVYAELLAKKLREHKAAAYLLNTGWVGGPYGVGKRCPLKYTRLIVDAINAGTIVNTPTETLPVFGLPVPTEVPGVPRDILLPWEAWKSRYDYDAQLNKLGGLFIKNFKEYADKCPKEVVASGPKVD